MGARTEIQHVEHCRHASAGRHQVLLGGQIALKSHVQGPWRRAGEGEKSFEAGARDTHENPDEENIGPLHQAMPWRQACVVEEEEA